MRRSTASILAITGAFALSLGMIAGCEEEAPDSMEETGKQMDDAADETADAMGDAMDEVEDAAADVADEIEN